MIHYTILGKIPSKKNSKRLFSGKSRTTGKMRVFVMPSSAYEAWHFVALQALKMTPKSHGTLEKVTQVNLTFFPHDRRLFDLSNKCESVMDLLVDAGILSDDNYSVVPRVALLIGEVDKENPRCEVEIVIP